MAVELKVPSFGESITEVVVGPWLKSVGDHVAQDENIVELESDKATFELPAASAGVITQILKQTGETVAVGDVIGYMDESGTAKPRETAQASDGEEAQAKPAKAKAEPVSASVDAAPKSAATKPAERAKAPAARSPRTPAAAPSATPSGTAIVVAPSKVEPVTIVTGSASREETVVPMSPIRKRIAQRLVEAQRNAALLTTINEIDMSAVIGLRKNLRDTFQQQYGVKLGFMSFFVKAAVEALSLIPQVNAEIRGNDIVYRNYFDIGIAVGSGKGLVVPVLRNAERMSFADIERSIEDFGRRAEANRIKIEELQGGTFTISNGGVYGSLLSTPIINPPQSGVLGMHTIQERPVVREGNIVIRPMMYVALTYDHRLVDGREAVTFLNRIREIVEQPSRLLIEV
jgi:2-oxoglutarate dehydrogenase E2 component (dihydrolipoamide succinyltransferase)